jgi:hypothetical protein
VIPVVTQHYAMLQRNLLCTGVTRGKRLVALVGQKRAVAIAVRNVSGRRRWTKVAKCQVENIGKECIVNFQRQHARRQHRYPPRIEMVGCASPSGRSRAITAPVLPMPTTKTLWPANRFALTQSAL